MESDALMGHLLRRARLAAGLTIDVAAPAAGISQLRLAGVEAGSGEIYFTDVIPLLKEYGLELSAFAAAVEAAAAASSASDKQHRPTLSLVSSEDSPLGQPVPRSRFAIHGGRSHLPYGFRLARYELMRSMREGAPPYDRPYSLQQIADALAELGFERMSRERVRQLLRDRPKPRRSERDVTQSVPNSSSRRPGRSPDVTS
jgi:hypothetical protein